jgi:hypothetical protein
VPHPLRLSKGAVFDFEVFSSGLRAIPAARPDLSFREAVTKLQKGDFFASKLIVFSVTFGRKTKKSQPPSGASRRFFFQLRYCEVVGLRSREISLRSIAQATMVFI